MFSKPGSEACEETVELTVDQSDDLIKSLKKPGLSAEVKELAEKLDSFSLRRILKAKWGKKSKYKGIKEPQTAVEHISEGHFFSSRPGKTAADSQQQTAISARSRN